MISRRQFVKIALLAPLALKLEASETLGKNGAPLKEALYSGGWMKDKKKVWCQLCPRG